MVLVQLDPSTELGGPWPASQGLFTPMGVEQKEGALGGGLRLSQGVCESSQQGGRGRGEGAPGEEERRGAWETPVLSNSSL